MPDSRCSSLLFQYEYQYQLLTNVIYSLYYLPSVKPSAIALGTIFTHASNLAVMAPLFGEAYQKAMNVDTKEEFKSKEITKTATLWGSNFLGSGVQTYAVAALLTQTGVMSYKGAAYIGALIFAATSVPTVSYSPI